MKRNFLITSAAAALLAGTMFAAAQQGQGEIKGQGGVSRDGGARVQGKGEAQGQIDEGKGKAQRDQKREPQTRGQGGRAEGQGKSEGQGKAQGKTPGQGGRDGLTQGQGGGRDDQGATQRQRDDGKASKQDQGPKGAQRDGAQKQDSGASVKLTTEQRTKIRTTVLQANNAPRVTNVNFSIRVGTVVPRERVRLVTISPILVEIYPQWRGYLYFIVNDQIIIVEPRSYKIVAVLVV